MSNHVHQLVLLGDLAGEYGGLLPIRWCRDCGAVIVGGNRAPYEVIPEWARSNGVDFNEKVTILSTPPKPTRTTSLVLGRTLNELATRGAKISKLPGT